MIIIIAKWKPSSRYTFTQQGKVIAN